MGAVQWAMSIIALVCVWVLVQNHLTHLDRQRLLDWVFKRGSPWGERLSVYDAVSYNRHLWWRVTLRDPQNLYLREDALNNQ